MDVPKLPGEDCCRALMNQAHSLIHSYAKRYVDYLRYGLRTKADEHWGRNIVALAPAQLSDEQLRALEATLRQVQEELLDAFLCMIDGSAPPEGFPDEVRLVNMATGEPICPEQLGWVFAGVGLEWHARLGSGGEVKRGD